jgi:LPXTG-motif cell wall-anchored protein
LSELDGSDENSTSAVYIFTNCTAHGFTKSIAKQNIEFLLKHYSVVVAVCTMKTGKYMDSDVTYEKFVFCSDEDEDVTEAEIDEYLDTIYWTADMHIGAEYQLSCFDACLDFVNPDAAFFSFDGSRGYDEMSETSAENIFGMSAGEFAEAKFPEPVLNNYERTLNKLAEIAKTEQLYLMIAEGSNTKSSVLTNFQTLATSSQTLKNTAYLAMMIVDPVTMSTESGRNEIKEIISDTSSGIDMCEYAKIHTYASSIYKYSTVMESTITLVTSRRYGIEDVIDPRFAVAGDITVSVVDPTAEGGFTVLEKDVDYTVETSTDAESGGTVVKIDFINWKGYPVNISIPVKLNPLAEFSDGNGDFDLTNIGAALAYTTNTVFNGATQTESEEDPAVSAEVESPKLYRSDSLLPVTGGSGNMMYFLFGLMLMALGALLFIRKKETGHEN